MLYPINTSISCSPTQFKKPNNKAFSVLYENTRPSGMLVQVPKTKTAFVVSEDPNAPSTTPIWIMGSPFVARGNAPVRLIHSISQESNLNGAVGAGGVSHNSTSFQSHSRIFSSSDDKSSSSTSLIVIQLQGFKFLKCRNRSMGSRFASYTMGGLAPNGSPSLSRFPLKSSLSSGSE